MKPSRPLWFLVLVVPLLVGCPYEAEVPLAEPDTSQVDPEFVGSWLAVDEDEADTTRVYIVPFNRAEIYVEVHESADEVGRMRAFCFAVGGKTFLHLNELGRDEPSDAFYFARYEFTADGALTLQLVGDAVVPRSLKNDAEGLRAFLEEHLDDPELLDEEPLLLRRLSRKVDW